MKKILKQILPVKYFDGSIHDKNDLCIIEANRIAGTNALGASDRDELLRHIADLLNGRNVIDQGQRVYHVVTSVGKQFFCNIEDLNRIVNENNMHSGYFKIYHFWNNKAQRVSQKDLKSFFEGAELKQEFNYQSR